MLVHKERFDILYIIEERIEVLEKRNYQFGIIPLHIPDNPTGIVAADNMFHATSCQGARRIHADT